MKELKCPHCQQVFVIDESEYAELLNQVKTESFNEELNRRVEEINKTQEAERKAALAELRQQKEAENAEKEKELVQSFAAKAQELNKQLQDKENKIGELRACILRNDSEKQIALMEAREKAQNELQKTKDEARHQLKIK